MTKPRKPLSLQDIPFAGRDDIMREIDDYLESGASTGSPRFVALKRRLAELADADLWRDRLGSKDSGESGFASLAVVSTLTAVLVLLLVVLPLLSQTIAGVRAASGGAL